MANHLKRAKQEAAIKCLVDGCSVRATERIVGVHRDTILRLMVRVGDECRDVSDSLLRGLDCRRIEADEIWTFIGAKARAVKPHHPASYGDVWTWVALDADSKLVPCYRVGNRDQADARAFVADLATRLSRRVQLSTDGLASYIDATERAFGGAVDYGQVVKRYAAEVLEEQRRYGPPKVTSIKKFVVEGDPDEALISTSYIERQNLTMRMCMRRFTRLTNAFSRKLENLKAAVAVHFAYYNFCRVHKTLRVTPAMAAGVTTRIWDVGDLISAP